MEIPKQLRKKEFRFILLKPDKKEPSETGWQVNEEFYEKDENQVWRNKITGETKHKGELRSYEYDDKKILEWLKDGNNVGILGGCGGLVVVDCDNPKIRNKLFSIMPKTFTGLSINRKLPHFYYQIDKVLEKHSIKDSNNEHLMDILGLGGQVVCCGSEFEDKKSEILIDHEVSSISASQLKSILYQFYTRKKAKEPIREEDINSNDDFIKKLCEKVNIKDVLDELGIDTSKNPTDCPLHSSKGHKCFSYRKNVAHCFNCEGDFNIISLTKQSKKLESEEAIDWLSGIGGLSLERQQDKRNWHEGNIDALPELEVLDLKAILSHKPSKKFIIKDFIYPSEICMKFGESGDFKSMICLNQCLCIASGKKFLGKFQTKKQPVLYLSAENHYDIDCERTRKMMRGLKIRSRKFPFHLIRRGECGDLMDSSFFERLAYKIRELKIGIVYLDTINPLTGSLDDNSARDVTSLFNKVLKRLADDLKVSVIFLHHTDKHGRGFLGSTKWFGNSDAVWRIRREKGTSRVSMYNDKDRGGEKSSKKIEIVFEEKSISLNFVGEEVATKYTKKKKVSRNNLLVKKMFELNIGADWDKRKIYEALSEAGINLTINNNTNKDSTCDRAIKEYKEKVAL
ncbi:AAA family ATPase [archaeon]|nr:AAA family ATPase [archaeon]